MKYTGIFLLLIALISGCNDVVTETYVMNVPEYITFDELRSSVKKSAPQDMVHTGKIYFKDNYIFVNEIEKGIHVIDNSDPSNPSVVSFIEVPGNVDLSIKGNILYADSYVDLVAIDISDIDDIKEVNRVENAFQYTVPEYDYNYRTDNVDQTKGVVVGWVTEEVTREAPKDHYYPLYPWYRWGGEYLAMDAAKVNGGAQATGVAGSMARFTIYDHYLYTVTQYELMIFDIEQPSAPLKNNSFYIGWNIETIFPYENRLFIGSQTGMYIYQLDDPLAPQLKGQYTHMSSCDPVVVEGNYAYVTLRAGNLCGESTSQLDVLDISNITNPKLLKAYTMQEPYGLGIDNNTLFVCDGGAGLKIYDATDPLKISDNMLAHFLDIQTYDVIPVNGVLMMIGADGLFQYDYSDVTDIKLLSKLDFNN